LGAASVNPHLNLGSLERVSSKKVKFRVHTTEIFANRYSLKNHVTISGLEKGELA
jgi:hypothetical protein